MVLSVAVNNFSIGFQVVIAASGSSFSGTEELASCIDSVRESGKGSRLLDHLENRGVAVGSSSDLQDPQVLEAIVADRDLSRRVRNALDQISDPGLAVVVRGTPPVNPWPTSVSRYFQPIVVPRGSNRWALQPKGFGWERATRDFSRQRNQGRLVYPKTLTEKRDWQHQIYTERRFGRRLGLLTADDGRAQILEWLNIQRVPEIRTPYHIYPGRLGFESLRGRTPEPGDLMTYDQVFFTGVAILTQVNEMNEPVEVLMPQGLSLYLTHPENAGPQRHLHRFDPLKKPDYLVVPPQPFEEDGQREPQRIAELRTVKEAITFTDAKFCVLRHGESSGLGEDVWLVDYDFANGDWAIFHLSITGEGKKRRLSVIADYNQRLPEDPPHFIMASERALLAAAQKLGFFQLAIFYKMIFNSESREELERELERRGYTQKNSPGWGRLPGKRIKIT